MTPAFSFYNIGLQMNRRVVCARCAAIKQACDGASPCARCKRLDTRCERNVSGSVKGTSVALTKPVKLTRTHTGCLTCKRRRRKCDEARPRCSDCRRLCLDCEYPAPQLRKHSSAVSSSSSSSVVQPSHEAATPSTDQQQSQVANDHDQVMLDQMDGYISWSDLTETWPETPPSNMAIAPSQSGSTLSSNEGLQMVMLSAAPDIRSDEDKSLLNHYMKVVAGVLSKSTNRVSNPYLTKILPMAFSNQLVMNSVLALSASHWKRMQPAVWKRGTIHQTNVLQSLGKLLPHLQVDSADIALVVTLMLCMIELFDGTSSHWRFHLDGARRLLSTINQESEGRDADGSRTFYRQLYHYLDSTTTISTCRPPLLEHPKEDESCFSGTPPLNTFKDEEALYGVPKKLFHFVDKLNGLAYQRKFREDPVFENMFRASASSLEDEIEQWSLNHVGDASSLGSPGTPEQEVQYATIAFEQALRLRLHQVVHGYSLQHPKVQVCLDKILEAIQEIRYGSPLENCFVFPLILAGSSCQTENEKLIVRDRLLIMERTLGFQYVYTAHDLVQRVWKRREACEGTETEVNWASIRYNQIPGLALI